MPATRLYKITRPGVRHCRLEHPNGEPVVLAPNQPRPEKCEYVHYATSGRNEILLTDELAAKETYKRMGLIAILGTGRASAPVKDDDGKEDAYTLNDEGEITAIAADWHHRKLDVKRDIVLRITGEAAPRATHDICNAVIEPFVTALAEGETGAE